MDFRVRSERRTVAGLVVGFDMMGLLSSVEAGRPTPEGERERTIRRAFTGAVLRAST
jgi:hypothetical protein